MYESAAASYTGAARR